MRLESHQGPGHTHQAEGLNLYPIIDKQLQTAIGPLQKPPTPTQSFPLEIKLTCYHCCPRGVT